MVAKGRKENMKFLTQTKNKHFYFDGEGCLFNTNLESCVRYVEQNPNPLMSGENSAKFYSSGALLTYKKGNTIDICFMKNNGERLFGIREDELNEMENTIYDINALVCGTGVLVAWQKFDGKCDFEYFTYTGATFKNNNYDALKKKVDKFEDMLGIYYDEPEKCKQMPNIDFLMSNLNEENGLCKWLKKTNQTIWLVFYVKIFL